LPPPPTGSYSGSFISQFQLDAQLRMLREKAAKRANHALTALRLAALLLLAWALFFMWVVAAWLLSGDPSGLLTLLLLPLCAAALSWGLLGLTRGGQLFDYHYRLAWQRMLHRGQALLFADDERLRLVQERLPVRLWGAAKTRAELSTLPQRIESCAYYLPCLRELVAKPEGLRTITVRSAEAARQAAAQLDNLAAIYGCCVAGLFVGWAQIGLVAYGLQHGPRVIEASAALCAFVDYYLEEPRIATDELPAPPAPRGW